MYIVQDSLTGNSWEHLGRPIGDLHRLLGGLEGSLQAFMATIFEFPGPYGQGVRILLPHTHPLNLPAPYEGRHDSLMALVC